MGLSAAEIRRLNYAQAVAEAGGVPEFVKKYEAYDLNPDYVRQLLNGKDVKGGRNIGARSARKIEAMLGKPENWLDQLHGPMGLEALERAPAPPKPVFQAHQQANDIHAIRLAVAALYNHLAATRPDEGTALASGLRETIEEPYQNNGLLQELLSSLDMGTAEAAKKRASKRARPSSKRSS